MTLSTSEALQAHEDPQPMPAYQLMAHQQAAVERARQDKKFCFFHDTGTGKTAAAISIIKELAKTKRVKALVVCPLSIIEVAWVDDFKKFWPGIVPVNLWALRKKIGTKHGKTNWHAALTNPTKDPQIMLINFESFRIVATDLQRSGFNVLIIDESSKVKSIKTKITKQLIYFADWTDHVYLFSGTPAPNSEMEYWTQVRMTSNIFGKSYYSWRGRYCYPYGYGGYQWALKKDMRVEFLCKLREVSEVVKKTDVLDLPERTSNIRSVYLTPTEKKVHDKMKRDLLVEFGDVEAVAANAAVKVMKLREATSGFMIGEEGMIFDTGTSKLDSLVELLQEIGDHQVVIWTQFNHEANLIQEALPSAGRIDGTVKSQTERVQTIRAFQAGEIPYLIAHPASLGHGVTLVNCSYMIYYSLSYSYEHHVQSMDRIYRKGQENKCTYYYLIAKDTVDEAIYAALKSKKKVVDVVLDYLRT